MIFLTVCGIYTTAFENSTVLDTAGRQWRPKPHMGD